MNHAQTMGDGTLRIDSSRSDPRTKAKVAKLNFWIQSQLSDWDEVMQRVTAGTMFGHLGPNPGADSSDGLQFAAIEELTDVAEGNTLRNLLRQSNPGERFQQGIPDNIEAVSQFRPAVARGRYGDIGLFRKLGKDPTWAEGKDQVVEGLLSGYWTLETHPSVRGNEEAERLRDCLEVELEPLLNPQFIQEFVEACFDDGFGAWEIVDGVDGGLRELAPINANTVEQWVTDPLERELERVIFNTGRRRYEVEAKHLMLYSHRRTGANFEGFPQIRSAAGFIEMKHAFWRLTGFAGEVHGLGIKTIEKTDPEHTADASGGTKVVEIFSELTAEDNPVIELPFGRIFKWHSPQNGDPNFMPIIQALNEEIARPATASGTLIGFSQFGSKALADVKDTEALRSVVYYGLLLAYAIQRDIIPRVARNKHGWSGRRPLPRLRYTTSREVKDPDRHKRLAVYVGAGMISWTDEDEDRLRAEEGMPPLRPEDRGRRTVEAEGTDPDAAVKEASAAAFNESQSDEEPMEAAGTGDAPASAEPAPEDLVSMRDAAARMNIPTNTISGLCRKGELRYWQLGRHRMVSLREVMELAAQAA